MRVSLVFVFSLIAVIYLSSESEAEENFTISVDPGWMDEKEGNCKTMTGYIGNSTEDGTYEYEECDYYLGYETNLTNDTYSWLIGDNGTIAEWRAKYYDVRRLPLTPNSLNSTFVFSLHGTNFSKNIEYTFSYAVYSHLDYEEWKIDQELSQITLAESQVTFFGNDSIEANLSGTFNGGVAIDSWISEDVEILVLKDECSTVYAKVKLEGKNVSTGDVSLSETYVSGGFFLNDTTREKCALYGYTNGYNYNSPDTTLVSIGLIGLPLSIIIFSYSSAQRLNTNMFVVLGLMVITIPVFLASYFIILLCWAFGANFGGGERDQEKYERSGEIGPVLITIGSFVSSLICLFLIMIYGWVSSDIRLKRNIILIGQSQSNLNIYEYNYVWSNKKYRGVMAQDLLKSNPEAVTKLFGYYLVNYNKIDVDFERI
tara:strand:- start:273 stop:1556 length:1284 start_codon:yes stop_codon:yes gene_type:complete